jgi:hypothetical protein
MQETSDGHVKKRKRECSMYAAAHVKKRKRECPKINLHRPVLGGCWPAATASNENNKKCKLIYLEKACGHNILSNFFLAVLRPVHHRSKKKKRPVHL